VTRQRDPRGCDMLSYFAGRTVLVIIGALGRRDTWPAREASQFFAEGRV